MGRITRERAQGGADRMAEYLLARAGPGPRREEIDAPAISNANQPSYYGKGTLPVVSTAGVGRHQRGEWSWRFQYVRPEKLQDFGLSEPVPPYAMGESYVAIVQRGDWSHWEFAMGQDRILHRWDGGAAHVISHHTTPVVLTHLEPRDIICDSYAQAEAECQRVGKTIAR